MGIDQRVNDFWQFFYTRLHTVKNPVYRHRELETYDPEEWEPLLKKRILVRAPEPETICDSKSVIYTVRKSGDRVFGMDESDERPTIIPLLPEDITEYKINSTALIKYIRDRNNIQFSGKTKFESLSYLGNYKDATCGECPVYFSIGQNNSENIEDQFLKLAKSQIATLVITPLNSVDHTGMLSNKGIFPSCLNPDFEINWPRNIHLPLIDENRLSSVVEKGLEKVGVKVSDLKAENEILKQSLADQMSNISGEVEPEYFTWILHILALGSVSGAAKSLGIANSTFDEKVKAYRARGGVYNTLYQLYEVRRNSMKTRKLERFNELYAEHQAENTTGGDLSLLRDIFDAFSEQAPDNWDGIRDEMLDLLSEYVPEK